MNLDQVFKKIQNSLSGLYVNFHEVPLSIRPIPTHSWPYSGSNNPPTWADHTGPIANSNIGYENDIRYKKTQLARTCMSTAKIRQIEKKEKYHYGNVEL